MEENLVLKCVKCKEVKNINEFVYRPDRHKYRKECKLCRNGRERTNYEKHRKTKPFLHRCTRAKTRATSLNVPFDLTPDYLESIWTGKCAVFETEINLATERNNESAAELDRIIPKLGYTIGNVCWLSRRANRLKNNAALEELKTLLEWMEKNCK